MYYVIEYDGLRKIMDVKHDMQTELQNQRFPSALADLMKTGDCQQFVNDSLHLLLVKYS